LSGFWWGAAVSGTGDADFEHQAIGRQASQEPPELVVEEDRDPRGSETELSLWP
jgi:hypothetical protein